MSDISELAEHTVFGSPPLSLLLTCQFLCVVNLAGPSQCHAVSVVQDAGGGKTLHGKPGHKGMIRSKVPEMCPIGALFRHLAIRFALEGEPIPTPGTSEWENFRLWPGQAGMPRTHADLPASQH